MSLAFIFCQLQSLFTIKVSFSSTSLILVKLKVMLYVIVVDELTTGRMSAIELEY